MSVECAKERRSEEAKERRSGERASERVGLLLDSIHNAIPTWIMNCGITRWNPQPLYPNPASPVHNCLKFSAVFGTTSPYRPNDTSDEATRECVRAYVRRDRQPIPSAIWSHHAPMVIRPASSPPMVTSKYTFDVTEAAQTTRAEDSPRTDADSDTARLARPTQAALCGTELESATVL